MLNLTIREEFRAARLKGTTVSLTDETCTGATQVAAQEFLDITYPTHDVLKTLECLSRADGRSIVINGERGQGKSHILAVAHHALREPAAVMGWLSAWSGAIEETTSQAIQLSHSNMHVVTESLHDQRIRNIWDLFAAGHPESGFFLGVWNNRTDVPSKESVLATVRRRPTALILDEFQTWFDGLTNQPEEPRQTWNFNFIQILSEIAGDHPDLLRLIVSIRNGQTEAYRQIHRVNPIQVDFKSGGTPERIQADRRRMLLHRLFSNRRNIDPVAIEALIGSHFNEYVRLLSVPESERDRVKALFSESWPFSPDLLRLLEDQILVATLAQETRDLRRWNIFHGTTERCLSTMTRSFRWRRRSSGSTT